MNEAIAETIEGFVEWSNAYMKKAQAELQVTTDKLRTGTFTAADAADGMMRAATLLLGGMASLASESMDAASTLSKYVGTRTLTTKPLSVGEKGAWKLAISKPLTNAQQEVLAPSTVSVTPDQLTDGITQTFQVSAVVNQVGGGLYVGEVTATNDAGATKVVMAKIQVG